LKPTLGHGPVGSSDSLWGGMAIVGSRHVQERHRPTLASSAWQALTAELCDRVTGG